MPYMSAKAAQTQEAPRPNGLGIQQESSGGSQARWEVHAPDWRLSNHQTMPTNGFITVSLISSLLSKARVTAGHIQTLTKPT